MTNEYSYSRPNPEFLKDQMPDAICTAMGQNDTRGFVVQLLTPDAYDAFPEALVDGLGKGLMWFRMEDLGNICALEEAKGLHFLGLGRVS